MWVLYSGGEFRFFLVSRGMGGGEWQVVASVEGLPGKVLGVGAIPLAPVVGDGVGGGGNGARSDGPLRATSWRMLRRDNMSTGLYFM